jgi:5-methylcytosine-specific restriction endonuclease McrA
VVRHGITDRRSLRKKYCTEKCRRAAGWVRKRPEPKPRIPWNKGLHAADDPRVAQLVKNLIVYKKGNKPWTTGKTHKEYPNIIHGPRVNTWKGGVTPEGHRLRQNERYKQWRLAVYRRDHFTCQKCGTKAHGKGTIVAHHIKGWQDYPELRYVVDNGITLCRSCHAITDPNIGRTHRNQSPKTRSDLPRPNGNPPF